MKDFREYKINEIIKKQTEIVKKHTETGRRKFFKVFFSYSAIIIILLLLQVGLLALLTMRLSEFYIYFNGAMVAIAVVLVIYIINNRENPSFKLAWMLPILVAPVFGSLLYLFVRLQLGTKWINARIQKLGMEIEEYMKQDESILSDLEETSQDVGNLAKYLKGAGGYPIYRNTSTRYLPTGEEKFEVLLEKLAGAKKFIFLEYFIIQEGIMWNTILEILEKKASEGVEVRVLYDGTCSLAVLPRKYPAMLQKKGIQCKMFSPIKPVLSTYQNNRDHRKIVVIDGHTAFTGGINLADEYINKKVRFGHWKDTAIMLEGHAVRSFTLMFLQMWNITNLKPVEYEKYLIDYSDAEPVESDGYVIPYGDSPLDGESVGKAVYLDILYSAKKYVHIMTPYLILDHETIEALIYAAKRQVEVIIMMPHIPDKKYAFAVARSHYQELIEAGVQIWEYTPGFLHSKSFISDDRKAVVGTINLDFRSLYMHFECAAFLYRSESIFDVERDFWETLRSCQKITLMDCKKRSFIYKLSGWILRIFAPLM